MSYDRERLTEALALVRRYGDARVGKALHNGDAQQVSCDTALSAVQDALAAARAAGAAEAFAEAVELMHAASTEQVKAGDDIGAVVLTAGALVIESHAAIRALAEREAK